MIVDRIAHDFTLEDRWSFDLGERGAANVEEFLPAFFGVLESFGDNILARIRTRVGRVFGWDDRDFTLPIPGCTEKSVAARLTDAEREASRAAEDAPSPISSPVFKTVYVMEHEALYEVSNDTIHALMHVSVSESGREAELRVYVKHRGVASKLYMAAIWPARHLILYPAMMKNVMREWRTRPRTT